MEMSKRELWIVKQINEKKTTQPTLEQVPDTNTIPDMKEHQRYYYFVTKPKTTGTTAPPPPDWKCKTKDRQEYDRQRYLAKKATKPQ